LRPPDGGAYSRLTIGAGPGERTLNDDDLRTIARRLDYIERYLTHLGQVAGYRYAPSGTGATPEVAELARLGNATAAIKLYRELTNANFEQAKEVIDQLAAGLGSPIAGAGQQPAGQGSFGAGSPGFGDGFSSFDAAPASFGSQVSFGGDQSPSMGQQPAGLAGSPVAPGPAGPGVPAEIVAMARAGKLIQAVKQYRGMTGLSLKDAKAAVEQAAGGF
jgi:ribosomal protein L7/L12